MKSIKLLVLSLCGLFSMSSCVNDFLDRDPMDIISEDLVWSNENAVNAYMAGMYEDMFVEPHAWLINWGTLGHYTDESMRSYSWGYPYTPVLDLSSLQQWEYNKIRIANVFLQNIQTMYIQKKNCSGRSGIWNLSVILPPLPCTSRRSVRRLKKILQNLSISRPSGVWATDLKYKRRKIRSEENSYDGFGNKLSPIGVFYLKVCYNHSIADCTREI